MCFNGKVVKEKRRDAFRSGPTSGLIRPSLDGYTIGWSNHDVYSNQCLSKTCEKILEPPLTWKPPFGESEIDSRYIKFDLA